MTNDRDGRADDCGCAAGVFDSFGSQRRIGGKVELQIRPFKTRILENTQMIRRGTLAGVFHLVGDVRVDLRNSATEDRVVQAADQGNTLAPPAAV